MDTLYSMCMHIGFRLLSRLHSDVVLCRNRVIRAFNSWDRLPYITTVRNGTASTIPAFNEAHHNFIVANYAADGGCLDNDDGSSYCEDLDTHRGSIRNPHL